MRTPVGSVILWVTSAGTTLPRSMPEVSQSFFALLQNTVLDRKVWATRIELSDAMFDYIGNFHNTRRRHSALDMLTPTEFETLNTPQPHHA